MPGLGTFLIYICIYLKDIDTCENLYFQIENVKELCYYEFVRRQYMEKESLNQVIEKTKKLIEAPTCCADLKEAASAWLHAVGTVDEEKQTALFLQELKEDIMPIDQLIGFAGSENGKKYFGEEKALQIVEHSNAIKQQGAVYCDCPACTIVEELINLLG